MRSFGLLALVLVACGGSSETPAAAEDGAVLDDTSTTTVDSTPVDDSAAEDTSPAETAVDAPAETAADAGPPGVRFIGRFDTTDPTGPRFAWSGSAMRARFRGTAIRLKLAGAANQFTVVIDATPARTVKIAAGTTTTSLATGLDASEHEVLVHRRTEAFFGESQFLGFEIDGGALLPPPPAAARRIEVIGDSITCGYGNEGKDQYCAFGPDTENHYATYAALAARALNADLHAQSWSGIGMYRNYGGETTGTMPERWVRTLPERTVSKWDTAKFKPDAVVINLGTNDFAKGDPGANFTTAYLKFVRDLRNAYPDAWIFPAVGPMLGGAQATAAKGYLNTVISTRKTEGDSKLSLLEFATQAAADGYGCDWHPSLTTNDKMSKVMIAAVKEKLGW